MDQRLTQQIDFVMELDRLKSVIRQIRPRALSAERIDKAQLAFGDDGLGA